MNYQQMEFEALIDLLAEETTMYTRAFVDGDQTEAANHKVRIAALIAEIKARKPEVSLPATMPYIPRHDYRDTAS